MKLHLTVHIHSVSSVTQSSGVIGRKGFFLTVWGLLCQDSAESAYVVIGHELQWNAKMQWQIPATDDEVQSFWSWPLVLPWFQVWVGV